MLFLDECLSSILFNFVAVESMLIRLQPIAKPSSGVTKPSSLRSFGVHLPRTTLNDAALLGYCILVINSRVGSIQAGRR